MNASRRGSTSTAIAVAVLLAFSVSLRALAQPASSQPSPAATDQALCLALLENLTPLDPAPGDVATTYAMSLSSLNDAPGVASGTVALFTGDQRYEVPFKGATVRGDLQKDVAATPIVVRFPRPIHVSRAYVSSLVAPSGGPCSPLSTPASWKIEAETPAHIAFMQAARALHPAAAPAGVHAEPAQCAGPDRDAATKVAVAPAVPSMASQQGATGTAQIAVILTDDARVVGVKVFRSSGNWLLDDAALAGALKSSYQTEIRNCLAIGGIYIYRAEFQAR